MERFTTITPLVLAKYHHSHSSFSLSDSLVILYCYEMPKCLEDLCTHLLTHSLCLKIVMNPIMPPTPSFVGRQLAHNTYSTSVCFVFRPANSVVKYSVANNCSCITASICCLSVFNCTSQQYSIGTKMM